MRTSKALLTFDVVTLMPEMFLALSEYGITGRAFNENIVNLNLWNPREFSTNLHKTVDDRIYGGGPGMLMMADPLVKSIEAAKKRQGKLGIKNSKVIHMTPRGKLLSHNEVKRLLDCEGLVIIASRYEGIDERVNDWIDEEISIGDYVLSGGELPAMVMMDAIARLVPGVLGHSDSAVEDSFTHGLLDCPHYTRPEVLDGKAVPDVLRSGDHEKIRQWRLQQSLGRTWLRRPELLNDLALTEEQQRLLEAFQASLQQDDS